MPWKPAAGVYVAFAPLSVTRPLDGRDAMATVLKKPDTLEPRLITTGVATPVTTDAAPATGAAGGETVTLTVPEDDVPAILVAV